MSTLVTGGAGFIGSNFIIDWFKNSKEEIINLDKLTYAANLSNLNKINESDLPYTFIKGDISDKDLVKSILKEFKIKKIINFAAESHVDRSIKSPEIFFQTNVIGTYRLLDAFNCHLQSADDSSKKDYLFLHISTDEVFGELKDFDDPFTEISRFSPNSPYSASKASSDHIVRAYHKTFQLPVIISNCSNNYGPYQFPEKLIPLSINNAINNKKINLYGNGTQIRDWLHVSDHCNALRKLICHGKLGETYNIGGNAEKRNIDVIDIICEILDELYPRKDSRSYKEQIQFVEDRPGHDKRYAINCNKIMDELDWKQYESFSTGIKKTIEWYLSNLDWLDDISKKQNNP